MFVNDTEMNKQREFSALSKELLKERFGHTPRAYIHVFGCQQNISDGQRMGGLLEGMGFEFTENLEIADLVLYVTCAVREHAQDRVFGNIGALKKLKKLNPNMIIVIAGCMVQQPHVAEKIKRSYPYVSIVMGTHVIHTLPELIFNLIKNKKRVFSCPECDGVIAEGIEPRRDGLKGWLPIMYGCNNFCTYCVVPYVRGRERSRLPEDIIAEAKDMVAKGFKEITLLGQNVNSYGKTLDNPMTFAQLLRELNKIEGEFILRFMTSHPKDCSLELLEAIRDCEKVERHLHLPFQSGNNRVLKEMNRGYTREHYLSLIEKAKELIPDLTLTSDVIVGFPGETEEEFEETLSLVKEVEYSALFTFIFSPREGTKASKMEDPVPYEGKSRWFTKLLRAQEDISEKHNKAQMGKILHVLCEEINDGIITGRTSNNIAVEFEGSEDLLNTFTDVEIIKYGRASLKGKIIKN